MNERIKLLAEQAGMNAIEPVMDFDRKETHWNGWASAMEKFAELIVRECAKVADIADENKCEWIGGNILTHFGVEE